MNRRQIASGIRRQRQIEEENWRLLQSRLARPQEQAVDWDALLDGDDLSSLERRPASSYADDPGEARFVTPSVVADERGERFEIVPERDVEPEVVAAAKAGHRFACLHLGLRPEPKLQWCAPAAVATRETFVLAGDVDAFADHGGRRAVIRADRVRSQRYAVEVAAHEVRHLAQDQFADWDENELQAAAYGDWAAGVLLGRPDRSERVARIFTIDGSPHSAALQRKVERGDVVIAARNGRREVYRNAGTATFLDWVERVPPPAAVAA